MQYKGGKRRREIEGVRGPNFAAPWSIGKDTMYFMNADHLRMATDRIEFISKAYLNGQVEMAGAINAWDSYTTTKGNVQHMPWCATGELSDYQSPSGTTVSTYYQGFFIGQPLNLPFLISNALATLPTFAGGPPVTNGRYTASTDLSPWLRPDLAFLRIITMPALRGENVTGTVGRKYMDWQPTAVNDHYYPSRNGTGESVIEDNMLYMLPWFSRFWCSSVKVKIHTKIAVEGFRQERTLLGVRGNNPPTVAAYDLNQVPEEVPNRLRVCFTPFRAFPMCHVDATNANANRNYMFPKHYIGATGQIFETDCPAIEPEWPRKTEGSPTVEYPFPTSWEEVWGRGAPTTSSTQYNVLPRPRAQMFHKEYDMDYIENGIEDTWTVSISPTQLLGLKNMQDGSVRYEDLAWSATDDSFIQLWNNSQDSSYPLMMWAMGFMIHRHTQELGKAAYDWGWGGGDVAGPGAGMAANLLAQYGTAVNMNDWLWGKLNCAIGSHMCISTERPLYTGQKLRCEYWLEIEKKFHGFSDEKIMPTTYSIDASVLDVGYNYAKTHIGTFGEMDLRQDFPDAIYGYGGIFDQ